MLKLIVCEHASADRVANLLLLQQLKVFLGELILGVRGAWSEQATVNRYWFDKYTLEHLLLLVVHVYMVIFSQLSVTCDFAACCF